MVTNDETTGRTGVCGDCAQTVEEGLLLKGMMVRVSKDPSSPKQPSPGQPVWRTLDRGHACARCHASPTSRHRPAPESIREGEQRAGAAFGL